MIKIVSDGTVNGTNVYDQSGNKLHGITRIEVLPLDADARDAPVTARITFCFVQFEIDAELSTPGGGIKTLQETDRDRMGASLFTPAKNQQGVI